MVKKILIVSHKKSVLGYLAKYYESALVDGGYSVEHIDTQNKSFLRYKLFLSILKREFDIINVHSSGYYDDISLLYGILLAKIKGAKCILTYHCGDIKKNLRRIGWLIYPFMKSCDKIVAVSDYVSNNIIEWKSDFRGKVITVRNFIDESNWNSVYCPSKKEKIILTTSAVNWHYIDRKGLDSFARHSSFFPDFRFYIVGKIQNEKAKTYLKKLGGENLSLLGYISKEELRSLYSRALVYCQFSRSEGLPIALLEAMAFGCIPVVTDSSSMPETVGNSGFYMKYGDVESAKKAIEFAISNRNFGILAHNRQKNHFSFEKRKQTIVNIFKEVLSC